MPGKHVDGSKNHSEENGAAREKIWVTASSPYYQSKLHLERIRSFTLNNITHFEKTLPDWLPSFRDFLDAVINLPEKEISGFVRKYNNDPNRAFLGYREGIKGFFDYIRPMIKHNEDSMHQIFEELREALRIFGFSSGAPGSILEREKQKEPDGQGKAERY